MRTEPIKPPSPQKTAPIPRPDVPPPGKVRPGRADWFSFRRPDHAKLAEEDRRFYAEAIKAVKAAAQAVASGVADATPVERKTVRTLAVKPQNQFDGDDRNACGTTSLASILAFFDPGSPLARHQVLDKQMRNADLFSAPDELLRFARENGYRAGMKTDASLDDIKGMLDKGVPVQVLVDPDNDGGDITLHYVAVTGYKADVSGKITHLTITDPAGGEVYEEAADHFVKRWANLKVGGFDAGFNRVMLTYLPDDGRAIKGADGQVRRAPEIDLPDDGFLGNPLSDSQRGRTLANGIANVVNGAVNVNPGRLVGGVVQTLGGAVTGLVGWGGHYLDKAGDSAFEWARDQWRNGGALGKVAGGFGFLGGGLAKGIGVPLEKVGNGASWAIGKVGDGLGWLGDKAVGGVKAIGDLFSGW